MSQPVQSDPWVLYQSPALSAYPERLIHGFTGKPLTLGGPGYDPALLRANRQILARAAGLNGERLTLPHQVHGARFRLNDAPRECQADAVIVTEPGIPAMIQVADCVPILIYAPDRHVGAAVHAGWRGTAQGVTARIAQVLIGEYGADPAQLIVAIGPAIGGCCYEVSPEVAEAVGQSVTAPAAEWQRLNDAGRPVVDLSRVNRLQLEALGIGTIETIDACTRCQADVLWSYRRQENGRQVGYLQLKPVEP